MTRTSSYADFTSEFLKGFAIAKQALARGDNMINTLRTETDLSQQHCIEIAYALQSGSYSAQKNDEISRQYRRAVQAILEPLCREHAIKTVFDCCTGESNMWLDFTYPIEHFIGLDLSLHRLIWADQNLKEPPFDQVTLCKGDMKTLPFAPQSFDMVVTMHALEPNGSAKDLLPHIAERANRFLVLFEPNAARASEAQQHRMTQLGYACDIWEAAEGLDAFECLYDAPLDFSVRADNQTSVRIMRRKTPLSAPVMAWQSPNATTALTPHPSGLLDEEGCFFFPKFNNIYCLAPEDAIFAGLTP